MLWSCIVPPVLSDIGSDRIGEFAPVFFMIQFRTIHHDVKKQWHEKIQNPNAIFDPGQPHIKSLSHQYVISEAIVQRRPDTLLPDTDLRWLALQQINRHMSNHSHIMRRVASTNPTLVFTERPGGRGRLPARGSHRSGRARFEHPAPRTMDSLRNGTHCAPRTLEGGDRSCATRRIAPTSSARATNAGPATCAIASRLRIGSVATPWRCR